MDMVAIITISKMKSGASLFLTQCEEAASSITVAVGNLQGLPLTSGRVVDTLRETVSPLSSNGSSKRISKRNCNEKC